MKKILTVILARNEASRAKRYIDSLNNGLKKSDNLEPKITGFRINISKADYYNILSSDKDGIIQAHNERAIKIDDVYFVVDVELHEVAA